MLEIEGKNKMGIWKDIKKGLKGSKEHQESVKKKDEGKGGKNWYPGKFAKKAAKSVTKDIKRGLKGSKEYQEAKAKKKVAKAEKKAGKSWTKAVKKQKKAGGPNLSTLVKARGMHKKGTAEYAKIQNQINKAYGSTVRHKAEAPKKVAKKVAPKKAAPKKVAPKKVAKTTAPKTTAPKTTAPKKAVTTSPAPKKDMVITKEAITESMKGDSENLGPTPDRKYAQGGKVESNPYGWPSRDARNGGKG